MRPLVFLVLAGCCSESTLRPEPCASDRLRLSSAGGVLPFVITHDDSVSWDGLGCTVTVGEGVVTAELAGTRCQSALVVGRKVALTEAVDCVVPALRPGTWLINGVAFEVDDGGFSAPALVACR